MNVQCASLLFMVRPGEFRSNEQTSTNNKFQQLQSLKDPENSEKALIEFDYFVDTLKSKGIRVVVGIPNDGADTPDQLFPNNWVSFHHDGRVFLYPMFAGNRRKERREELLWALSNEAGIEIDEIVDLTEFEQHKKYLEGTGSMVFDHQNQKAYAALSDRTDLRAFELFCEAISYQAIAFHAYHEVNGKTFPIYHTNVMMSIGETIAIICADSIHDEEERKMVLNELRDSNRELIFISTDQVDHFAGNVLMVKNIEELNYMIMSESAFNAFELPQIELISKHANIISIPLPTIEKLGGGSARCMITEVFLPKV